MVENGAKCFIMVLGEYGQRFNGKNRVALVKKIRQEFGRNIILAKGYDNCIFGFSEKTWLKLAEQEFEKPISSEEGRKARRKIFSGAESVGIDNQGRIVIPESLLTYAQITNDNEQLVIVGAGDHLEIWKKENWDRYTKDNL